jgi:glycine cleavage system aminomethyltransferase T
MNVESEEHMAQSADIATQRSPIQDWLDAHAAQQRVIGGSQYVVRFAADDAERTALETLGLCDMSGLRKLGLKGPAAERSLLNANLDVPTKMFESRPLTDDGLIVRFGANEFFLESGIRHESFTEIIEQLDLQSGQAFCVDHQESTFLLTGLRALAVLSQTCGINFRAATSRQAIFTRVAGVSCCVLPDAIGGVSAYRIWVDPSYALFLWETLVEISVSLGGSVIGLGCVYTELVT